MDLMLPSNETIMEAMNLTEKPSEINHESSHFLPILDNLSTIKVDITIDINFKWYKSPLTMHDTYAEGNMVSISQKLPMNISNKPSIVENLFIKIDCSPNKIKT